MAATGTEYILAKVGLRADQVEWLEIWEFEKKFPTLSLREILMMYKYVTREKLEQALFQVSSFLSVEEYLNKFCNLRPVTIWEELYS